MTLRLFFIIEIKVLPTVSTCCPIQLLQRSSLRRYPASSPQLRREAQRAARPAIRGRLSAAGNGSERGRYLPGLRRRLGSAPLGAAPLPPPSRPRAAGRERRRPPRARGGLTSAGAPQRAGRREGRAPPVRRAAVPAEPALRLIPALPCEAAAQRCVQPGLPAL